MIHETLAVGPLACNCTIFGDESTREAFVVDPGDQAGRILSRLAAHGLATKAIVLTHGHIDHVGAVAELRRATGAPVYLNEHDFATYSQIGAQAAWLGMEAPELADIDGRLGDGDTLQLGSTRFTVLHTPGHTPGSVALWAASEQLLVSGDTLFRESIGRTDLPGGDARRILVSIRQKLLPLPDETVVIPGHGPETTMGHEKRYNYFLQRLAAGS